MSRREQAQFAGDPGVIIGVELQLRQRVAPVRVETGRYQQQLRPERIDGGEQAVLPCRAEPATARARRQRRIEDVADPTLVDPARIRIQRHLVRTEVLHARFGFEDRLGAVAVVHVEVDDRHARQTVPVECMRGRDRDVVEQAEAHRGLRGGVVAGRAYRAEGRLRGAGKHGIDRGHRRAGRAQRRFGGGRRQHRVRIQSHALVRARLQHDIEQRHVVHPQQLSARGAWRFAPVEVIEGGAQGVDHRTQALRPLGVAGTGVVREAGRMRVDRQRHAIRPRGQVRTIVVQRLRRSWCQSVSPWPLARASTRASTNSRSDKRLR